MIKLVAIDIDGTLLNSQQQLTERTENALKKAIEQGVKIVLATGKTRHSANTIMDKINLNSHGIFLQGLAIYYPDGSIRHQLHLDVPLLRRVITFAEDRGFNIAAYAGSRILVRTKNRDADELAEKYHEPQPEAVGTLQNILDSTPINKLLIIKKDDPKKITALRWQLGMQLNNSAKLVQAAIADQLEVVPTGSSKGKALKILIKELGIPAEQVLAIGDGENDIEMIELAGSGVAVGNAMDKLKAVAKHIVASNDEDGVAEALEKFVLKKEEAPIVVETKPETTTPDQPAPTDTKPESEAKPIADEAPVAAETPKSEPAAEETQPAVETTENKGE